MPYYAKENPSLLCQLLGCACPAAAAAAVEALRRGRGRRVRSRIGVHPPQVCRRGGPPGREKRFDAG